LTDDGNKPQETFEKEDSAERRCLAQEEVWNVVWRRRFIYFITVFASFYIVIFPLATKVEASAENVSLCDRYRTPARNDGSTLTSRQSAPSSCGYARTCLANIRTSLSPLG
jgi:hypothetical protein